MVQVALHRVLPLDEHYRFDNTATGWRALRNNITSSENTVIIAYALQGNTIGIQRSALGKHALYFDKDGNYNRPVGFEALNRNNGNYNSASGVQALFSKNTGRL